MTWNWPLAAVVMALLLFGYCIYAAHETSRSVDRAGDFAITAQGCYDAGYQAGTAGSLVRATPEGEDCARWFEAGLKDGQRLYDVLRPWPPTPR